jgi:hypothetical protein
VALRPEDRGVDDHGRGERHRNSGRLDHVLWIGGGSAAGKSTIAQRLALEHGLQLYATDHAMGRHAAALNEQQAPYLARFQAMTMDERWVERSPQEMLNTFHWFRGEGFHLIVDDLLHMPPVPPVIVEGFRLLPHLVAPLLTDVRRAVWLLPTPAFRRAAIESRGTTWAIASRTRDPARALDNLLVRDHLFTARLHDEAERLGLHLFAVDVGITPDELAARVAASLRLPEA